MALLTTLCLASAQARDPMGALPGNGQRAGVDAPRSRALAEADTQQELLLRQKRRDDLRETLRVQGEEVGTTNTARQLSAQERMELRQQLRQQQELLSK
jgi:hypothetical protein